MLYLSTLSYDTTQLTTSGCKSNMRAARYFSAALVLSVTSTLASKRFDRPPRAICLVRKGDLCTTRVISGIWQLGDDGIDAIVIECEKDCEVLGMKCEHFMHGGDVVEYTCKPMRWERYRDEL